VVENLFELSDAELGARAVAVAAEVQRRFLAVAAAKAEVVVEALIGPDETCALLNMTKRKLYALEKRGLPFARSRSRKDRAYSRAGVLKWRERPSRAA
jgi:hypothetical protein